MPTFLKTRPPAQKRIPGYQPCPLLRHPPESGVNTREDTHHNQTKRKPPPNLHHHCNNQQHPIYGCRADDPGPARRTAAERRGLVLREMGIGVLST
jgi:hypothetical protein